MIGACHTSVKALESYYGILVGGAIYFVFIQIFEFVVQIITDSESMNTFDEVFLLDDPKNYCNLLGCQFADEFEFEGMRDYIIQKSAGVHKCRSKVV